MGLFGNDDKGFDLAKQGVAQNRGLYNSIALPDYAEMVPELYNAESFNYELMNEDPVLKSAQMEALKKMAGLSNDGLAAEDTAAFSQARNMAAQQAKGEREAAMQSAQARGVGGGGLEFAMREMANQGAATRAQDAGLQQAAASARQRALYNQAYMQGLGGVRGQDAQTAQNNTDIINRFNQMNTQQRNSIGQANVDKREDAFRYNQGLKDKRYANQIGQADRIAGLNDRESEINMAQEEARRRRRQAMAGLAGTVVGGAGGAMVGGPMGAAYGAQLGGQVGSTLA